MIRLFIIFFFCLIPEIHGQCSDAPSGNHIREVTDDFAKELEEKYGLQPQGDFIYSYEACLSFGCHQRASIEEARHLVVYIKEELAERIRSSNGAAFNVSDAFVDICFYDSLDSLRSDGSISHVLAGRSEISYYQKDAFTDRSREIEESYEEAKRIVETEMPKAPIIHTGTEFECAFDEFRLGFARAVADRYRLEVWGIGCQQGDLLDRIDIRMTQYRKATEKRARAILTKAVAELVTAVNSNESMRPSEGEFTADKVRLRINFRNNRGCPFERGSLESVELVNGVVTYFEDQDFERVAVRSERYTSSSLRCS